MSQASRSAGNSYCRRNWLGISAYPWSAKGLTDGAGSWLRWQGWLYLVRFISPSQKIGPAIFFSGKNKRKEKKRRLTNPLSLGWKWVQCCFSTLYYPNRDKRSWNAIYQFLMLLLELFSETIKNLLYSKWNDHLITINAAYKMGKKYLPTKHQAGDV